jgi:hypothetical protein
MKQLIFKLIVPLTIISFGTITKWWFALPVDAPHTFYTGFPFPYVCDGWHTSMSLQVFFLEFFADFFVYFFSWLTIVYCFEKYVAKIRINKIITFLLWGLSALIILFTAMILRSGDHVYMLYRNHEMEIIDSGFKFSFQYIERPELPIKNERDEK